MYQKNPRAHKNKIGTSPPPPKKNPNTPSKTRNFTGIRFSCRMDAIFPGAHKIVAGISGPGIADKKLDGHEDFSECTWYHHISVKKCEVTLRSCRGAAPVVPPSPYTRPLEGPKILLKNRTCYKAQRLGPPATRLRKPKSEKVLRRVLGRVPGKRDCWKQCWKQCRSSVFPHKTVLPALFPAVLLFPAVCPALSAALFRIAGDPDLKYKAQRRVCAKARLRNPECAPAKIPLLRLA